MLNLSKAHFILLTQTYFVFFIKTLLSGICKIKFLVFLRKSNDLDFSESIQTFAAVNFKVNTNKVKQMA